MSAAACTQLISDSRPRDGQARFGQRCITSPSGFTIGVSQSGQRSGIRNSCVPGRCAPAGPTIWGITSPARWMITSSPSRICLRLMSSSLCSVARDTVTPPTSTGCEDRPRVQRPGAPDADRDLVEPRHRGHRRPLERARPARPLVQRAEAALLVERVDLDHDAVDLVVERRCGGAPSRGRPRRPRRPTRAARRTGWCGSRGRGARPASPSARRARRRRRRRRRRPTRSAAAGR